LSLSLLREYLELEFEALLRGKCAFAFDLERIIDDFVFICFLIGNDFLPNLPALDIAEGGLDVLFRFYAEVLPEAGGYLTEGTAHKY
jgi:5'-3' exonuclease